MQEGQEVLTATKCTVQPVTLTPACSTSLCACAPLKDGSSDGWMFRIFPGKAELGLFIAC